MSERFVRSTHSWRGGVVSTRGSAESLCRPSTRQLREGWTLSPSTLRCLKTQACQEEIRCLGEEEVQLRHGEMVLWRIHHMRKDQWILELFG